MNNSSDSVFDGIPVGEQEAALVQRFLSDNDFSPNTRRAFAQDLGKFGRWFTQANREPFRISRVTVGDVSSFRDHLRRDQAQAISTVNRALVTIRRFFSWLVEEGQVTINPAKKVKELRRVALAPKGMDRASPPPASGGRVASGYSCCRHLRHLPLHGLPLLGPH